MRSCKFLVAAVIFAAVPALPGFSTPLPHVEIWTSRNLIMADVGVADTNNDTSGCNILIRATVTRGGNPSQGETVSFSVSSPVPVLYGSSGTTDSMGRAYVRIRSAQGCRATVTATVYDANQPGTATTMPLEFAAGSFELYSDSAYGEGTWEEYALGNTARATVYTTGSKYADGTISYDYEPSSMMPNLGPNVHAHVEKDTQDSARASVDEQLWCDYSVSWMGWLDLDGNPWPQPPGFFTQVGSTFALDAEHLRAYGYLTADVSNDIGAFHAGASGTGEQSLLEDAYTLGLLVPPVDSTYTLESAVTTTASGQNPANIKVGLRPNGLVNPQSKVLLPADDSWEPNSLVLGTVSDHARSTSQHTYDVSNTLIQPVSGDARGLCMSRYHELHLHIEDDDPDA